MPEPDEPADVSIAILMMEREEEGLQALLRKHGPKVRGWLDKKYSHVLNEHELEDAFWIATERAWERSEQYDESKGSLGGWFLRIAQHAAIDLLRGNLRRREEPLPDEDLEEPGREFESSVPEPPPLTTYNKKVQREVNDIISKLPPQQQRITLADIAAQGTADSERLAAELSTSSAAVHTARSKARKTFREELEKRGLAPPKGVSDERRS